MKYNFIKVNGEIVSGDSCLKLCGYDWTSINRGVKLAYPITKKENEFLNHWKLRTTTFNIVCLRDLKMVYLNRTEFLRIKKMKGATQ